jgi:hypothetical protein
MTSQKHIRRPTMPEHGVQLNEHLEVEGPLVFEHACRNGTGGHRLEAEGLALSVRALAALG